MDKIKFHGNCLSSDERIFADVKSDDKRFILPIDQSFGMVSNINPATGFPFTDIQLVMRAQSLAERNTLMDNLQSTKPDFIDDSITDEAALDSIMPSSAQLASEVADYQDEKLHGEIVEHNSEVEAAKKNELFNEFMKKQDSKEVEPKN